MTKAILATVFSIVAIFSLPVSGQEKSVTPDPKMLAKCESCHGARGDSVIGSVPRLNGQRTEYLQLRLKEFLDLTRSSPHAIYQMWETASNLGGQADALARYFGSQRATPATGTLVANGARIYRDGVGPDVPPCQTCHGAAGEGRDNIPRLAGQHADYLSQEIYAFELSARISDPMNHHAMRMRDDQIKAVSAFLANK